MQKASPSDDDSDYIVFLVHDIVLDYLQQKVPSNKQVGPAPDLYYKLHMYIHTFSLS